MSENETENESENIMRTLSARRILLTDIQATPWKNGGGVTREIATGGTSAAGQGWGWRFSIAEVARDGPFSLFPGTDRVIAVIDGEGMDLLDPDGRVTALEPFQSVRLSGENTLFGRLRGGPVQDLNIMTLRDRFEATLDIAHGLSATALRLGNRDCLLVHSLFGQCTVHAADGKSQVLAPSETLVQEGPGAFDIELDADARAAVISIKSRQEI